MHVLGNGPKLMHAELHSQYLPWPENPHLKEATNAANAIRREKELNGSHIYDTLVDSLVENTLAVAKQYEHAPESQQWTPPQRCVWRFSQIPYEQRFKIVEDRSVASDVKAFAVVNAGRWLIQCPFPNCMGAQYASFQDRRFLCVDCCNKAVSGQWVEVVWPSNHLEVERWLEKRPIDAMHWNPGEVEHDIALQDVEATATVGL